MQSIRFRILAILAGLFTFTILPSAASAGDWGAIALSTRTGAWGTSYNYDDEDEARERAMRECRKNARDCKVFRTFESACDCGRRRRVRKFRLGLGLHFERAPPPRDRTVSRARWQRLQGRDDVLHWRR